MSSVILRSAREILRLDKDRGVVESPSGSVELGHPVNVNQGDTVIYRGEPYVAIDEGHIFAAYARRRRTQIMQPWDSAFILELCNIGPGSRVLESGLGTGSLSRMILKRIGDNGKLTTVERNREIIDALGIIPIEDRRRWTILEGEVESVLLEGSYDSVVLDVPEPWKAVKNVDQHIRPGGFFCSYVPTYNQLEKVYLELEVFSYEIIEASRLVR
ncbi:MAG: hypothetical protein QW812_05020, partial [Thermoplasmataceae archaeon]